MVICYRPIHRGNVGIGKGGGDMLKLLAGAAIMAAMAQTAPVTGGSHRTGSPQPTPTPTGSIVAKSISEAGPRGPAPERPKPRPSPKPGVKFGSE